MTVPDSEVVNVELIASNDADSSQGSVALVTINRPNKLNALNSDVMESIKKVCQWVESEDSIRCVVFTGAKPLSPEEGKRPKMDHPDGLLKENGKPVRVCKYGKENDWPEGYSYLDRFLEQNEKDNNGDIVFMAISVGDYEIMSGNMQELRRYIREVQEVVVYYRNVTINDKPAVGAEVKLKQ